MATEGVKIVTDADGNEVEVIVPITVWRDLVGSRAEGGVPRGESMAKNARATSTQNGIDEVSGLPVFINPPGSPTLTSEHVKMLEDDW